jgi:glycosyltransferase involved in cell wall biosynthesis
MGVPVIGTYHTDFPSYARALTGDAELEHAARSFMHWYYGQMDAVAVPSPSTARDLAQLGLDSRALHVVGRGVDTDRFRPARRDAALRVAWGDPRKHHLLYAGRISKEKNLACLATAFRTLCQTRNDVKLIVVGDGPYREEMAAELRNCDAVFPGVLRGLDLAAAYATCDLFVFPSETDTLGVVLLEAQASGLPVIVSPHGGPKDCMVDGVTGRVVNPMDASNLAEAICDLLRDPRRLTMMGEAARQHAGRHTPAASFDAFWRFCRAPTSALSVAPAAETAT